MAKNVAIILAGGVGERVGYHKPKQFIKIAGKTILEHTIDTFEKNQNIDAIYVVINPNYRETAELILNGFKKVKKILNGGKTRQESSRIGVYAIDSAEKVIIHDAVRPFVNENIINKVINCLDKYCAVDVAIPSTDTIIEINEKRIIERVPKRSKLWLGQTPQGFRYEIIKKAHELAEKENFTEATDDCGLITKYKLCDVYVVKGDPLNIKITFPHDIYLADKIFQIKNLIELENVNKEKIEQKLSNLKNKKVVIFGGTSGIGKEIANLVKKYGGIPYVTSRRKGVDIVNYTQIVDYLKKVGPVDIVINSAGVLYRSPIETEELSKVIEQIEVNLIGAFNVVKASINYLKGDKSIILFTSSSYTRGRAYYTPYSASKAGIVNMVQGLSEELYQKGIKINAISPARTKTPMRFKNFGKEPEDTLLDPKTVAYVTLLTALSDITGQVIDVKKEIESKFIDLMQ